MSNGKLLKKKPVNSDQHCFVAMYAVFWLLFLHVKVFFFLVTFDSLVMFCLDYGHCSAHIIAIYSQNTKVMWNCINRNKLFSIMAIVYIVNIFTYALIYESHAL